jgi:methylmalonyl-CoA/ethylmalonyl-CoA epimerase
MKIDHIGIATHNIAETVKFWRDSLGLGVSAVEDVSEQGVRVAMLPIGESRLELLEPTGPASPVAGFLAKRGPGIHHIAVQVDDIQVALSRLKEQGARLIDESPRKGAGGCLVAFVHPTSADGVLLELVQRELDRTDGKEEH